MYSITFVERFLHVNVAKVISFVPSIDAAIPLVSRRFASVVNRFEKDTTAKSKANYVFISGDLYAIQKLPKPYDTRCTDNPAEDECYCAMKCNHDVYTQYSLVSPMDAILKPSKFRPFLVAQKGNESLMQEIKTKLENCNKDCHTPPCFYSYSVSQTITFPYMRLNSLSIASTCSDRPTTQIVFTPKITIIDYVVYLSGCLGIWCGVSVISLNPFSKKNLEKSNALPILSVPLQLRRTKIQPRLCKQTRIRRDCLNPHFRLVEHNKRLKML
jgi:hypothetical protein